MTSTPATARQLLEVGGPLSESFADYEARPGQLDMADAVERVLHDDGILLCEAGTGTGKTLAYLLPAIASGRRVVVSTATRALQEQIAARDLPLIERTLGLTVNAQVLKGLGNYLCLRRFEAARASGAPTRQPRLAAIEAWRRRTLTGDIAELRELPETDALWRDVTSSSDTRIGSRCVHFEDCFVTRVRRKAERARLLIVNHHLFFADLALRGPHPGRVLPDYDCVIFDEAHQLESIATDFFGRSVSSGRIDAALRDGARALESAATLGVKVECAAPSRAVSVCAETFWAAIDGAVGATDDGRALVERDAFSGKVAEAWHALDAALEHWSDTCTRASARLLEQGGERSAAADALELVAVRTQDLRAALAEIADGARGYVAFLESSLRAHTLNLRPVNLAETLKARIFESVPAVVLTSATLATGSAESENPFRYVRSRLGLGSEFQVTELVVPTPFDLQQQALLYTPRDLPSPRDTDFLERAAERIGALITLTRGGAFVLTTSLRSMRQLAVRLRAALPTLQVLCQGDAPKNALLDDFRADGHAVLVATLSFWEGVDVPGHALRLVVLEKVPFSVPTDPVLSARCRALEEEGGNAFMDLIVPSAAIMLKQGFGRLIRSKSDRGIVALLDERVHRRGYGKRLLNALPPAARTDAMDDVVAFCRHHALGATSADAAVGTTAELGV